MSMGFASWVDELKTRLLKAVGRLQGQGLWMSVTVQIPWIDPLVVFGKAQGDRTLLESPAEGLSMVGVGSLWRMNCHGKDRFETASLAWKGLLSRMVVLDQDDDPPVRVPVGFAGFAFDLSSPQSKGWLPFGRGCLVLPKVLVVSKGGLAWLTLNLMPERDTEGSIQNLIEETSRLFDRALKDVGGFSGLSTVSLVECFEGDQGVEGWQESIAEAILRIRKGEIQKVVLARRVCMQHEGGYNPVFVLNRMRHDFSECTLFAFFKDGRCFLGATPERLVRLDNGNRIQVSCLAGSTGRGVGPKGDLELKERLLSSPKNRLEHALVVDAIRKTLEPVCKKLAFPSSPTIATIKNIHHLYTPILGILKKNAGSVLELVGLLHPTPAVGGLPKEKAISLIREFEGFDRGWYSGPVGWIDGSGGGGMFVAIRCALLSAYEAVLYAGCGIVADSDPKEELEESRLKLEAMRWMLTDEG